MPYKKEAAAVIAMWREVEQQLHGAPEESAEAARLTGEWARLRAEHQRLTALAEEHHRPAPPPWPVATVVASPRSDSDTKRDLADASDELLAELGHLKETEVRKREESISTQPFHRLADDVSASSRRIYELGSRLEDLGDESKTGVESIEDVERTG